VLQFAKRLVFGSGARPHKVWFGVGAGCRFVIDPASLSQRIVGLNEAEIAGVFRRSVRDIRTFVDVGASDGYYPIIALRLNPNVTAIGCEAQECLKHTARENYRLNFPDGGPSMEWVAKLVGGGEGQASLDQIAEGRPGPILLKIDVDGAEIEVLRSGSRLLARADCKILLEVHSPELERAAIELLRAQGFSCRIVKNAWWRSVIPEHRPIELNRWLFAEKPGG
jgi:hypothetical protein